MLPERSFVAREAFFGDPIGVYPALPEGFVRRFHHGRRSAYEVADMSIVLDAQRLEARVEHVAGEKALASRPALRGALEDVIDQQALAKLVVKRRQPIPEDHIVPAAVPVDQSHSAALLRPEHGFQNAHDRRDAASAGDHHEVPFVDRLRLDGEVPGGTQDRELIAFLDGVNQVVAHAPVFDALDRYVHRYVGEARAR